MFPSHDRGRSGSCVRIAGAGTLLSRDLTYLGGVTDKFIDQVSGFLVLQDSNITNGTIRIVYNLEGGAETVIQGLNTLQTFSGSTGFAISGAVNVQAHNVFLKRNLGIGIHFSAESSSVSIDNSNIEGGNYDILADSGLSGVGSSISSLSNKFRIEKTSIGDDFYSNADVNLSFLDDGVQNDKSYRFLTEMSVGSRDAPKESAFGEGDSSVNRMVVFTSGSGGFVDNTVPAQSATESTFSLFGGTTSGSAVYIGHPTAQFPGVKIDIVTAQTGSRGVWEFWNGSGWEVFPTMTADAVFPYASHATESFTNDPGAYHTRFNMGAIQSTWALTTVNGAENYWIRHALTGAITTDPVLQRIKLHTNRTEINADGFVEYFGRARPRRDLVWHKGLDDDLQGASPGNASISLSSNITITPTDNSFNDGVLDGNGGLLAIPEGLGTAEGLTFTILWIPSVNGAPGNVELEMRSVPVNLGSILSGSLVETLQSEVVTVGTNDALRLIKTEFTVDTESLHPGDLLAFSYFRDARGSNGDDTYAGSVRIVKTSWSGLFWR